MRLSPRYLLVLLVAALFGATARAAFVPVDLSAAFNNDGVATKEKPDDGDFDAIGDTQPGTFHFSAEGFPTAREARLAGVDFRLGSFAPGKRNNVVAHGQEVAVPTGRYAALYVLAATTNGSYTGTWTLRYANGAPRTVDARFSDWCAGPGDGEAVAIRSPYRYFQDGGIARDCTPMIYVRALPVDAGRDLTSIVLPRQPNTHVFAMTLGTEPALPLKGLPPPAKPQDAGPRIHIESDAAMGALVVPPGPARLTATADRLPENAGALVLTVTDADGNVLAKMESASGARGATRRLALALPDLSPGYYALDARLAGTDTVLHAGLAVVPDDLRAEYRPDSPFGVNAGFDQEPETARKAAFLARRAGVRWVRQGFDWGKVEPEPGRWEWTRYDASRRAADREKLLTLGLLAYWAGWSKPFTPEGYLQFDDYARAVVSRYPEVTAWEVWNEPNIFYWKGTPEQYAVLLRSVTPAIHAANPKAKVLGMATAFSDVPFIRRVLDAGARPDIVSVHPYRGGAPDVPSKLLQFDGGKEPHTMAEETRGVKTAIEDRPLWFTEVGWWSAEGGVSEQTQADYLARTYAISLAGGAAKIFWYAFIDAGTQPGYDQDHFGLLRPDLSPKPSYAAYATAARLLDGATFVSADEQSGGWTGRFRRGDETITVAWARGPASARLLLTPDGTKRRVYRWDGKPLPVGTAVGLGASPVYVVEGHSPPL